MDAVLRLVALLRDEFYKAEVAIEGTPGDSKRRSRATGNAILCSPEFVPLYDAALAAAIRIQPLLDKLEAARTARGTYINSLQAGLDGAILAAGSALNAAIVDLERFAKASRWATDVGTAIPASERWSKPRSQKQWSRLLGISDREFRERITNEQYAKHPNSARGQIILDLDHGLPPDID